MSLLTFKNEAIELNNPFDVRPYVNAIIARLNWLESRLPPDVPIIICLGEHHGISSHLAASQTLLESLKNCDFSLGYEAPAAIAPHGQLETTMIERMYNDAISGNGYLARSSLYQQCVDQKLFGNLNDIANVQSPGFGNEVDIDEKDPQAMRLIRTHVKDYDDPIVRNAEYAPMTQGMLLSNHAIVENALAHLAETKHRLYVQLTGSAHVTESTNCKTDETFPHANGLTQLFMQQGCAVIAAIPYAAGEITEYTHDYEGGSNLIYARGLDQTIVDFQMRGYPVSRAEMEETPEALLLKQLQQNSGDAFTLHIR